MYSLVLNVFLDLVILVLSIVQHHERVRLNIQAKGPLDVTMSLHNVVCCNAYCREPISTRRVSEPPQCQYQWCVYV